MREKIRRGPKEPTELATEAAGSAEAHRTANLYIQVMRQNRSGMRSKR